MKQSRLLSVLIVTYNRKDDIKQCLERLAAELHGMDAEVLIVDNGSLDGTPEMLAKDYPWVHLYPWRLNRGMGPALYHLVECSLGEWLLFLDSDAFLMPGCLKSLLTFAQIRSFLGAVAPRIRDLDGQIQLVARRFPTIWNALFGRQTLLSKIWPNNQITKRYLMTEEQEGNSPFLCDWLAFSAALIRRQAALSCGSIDSEYFVYWVDADFFRRLKKTGWEVWCFPEAEVQHLEHNRAGRIRTPLAIKAFHQGALQYFRKHHGYGMMNPLLLLAMIGLWFRCQFQIVLNSWRKRRV